MMPLAMPIMEAIAAEWEMFWAGSGGMLVLRAVTYRYEDGTVRTRKLWESYSEGMARNVDLAVREQGGNLDRGLLPALLEERRQMRADLARLEHVALTLYSAVVTEAGYLYAGPGLLESKGLAVGGFVWMATEAGWVAVYDGDVRKQRVVTGGAALRPVREEELRPAGRELARAGVMYVMEVG
jgi:hypothetical protein